jgi:hypothetical protein
VQVKVEFVPEALDPIQAVAELTKVGGLRNVGVLTEDEFATQKAKLLG